MAGPGNRYNLQLQNEFFVHSYGVPIVLELSPTPYAALRVFWGYNFFARRHSPWSLDYPTLIISGSQDPMFTGEMGDELVKHFSNGRHLYIKSAGHQVMAEYPDRVNTELVHFRQSAQVENLR